MNSVIPSGQSALAVYPGVFSQPGQGAASTKDTIIAVTFIVVGGFVVVALIKALLAVVSQILSTLLVVLVLLAWLRG